MATREAFRGSGCGRALFEAGRSWALGVGRVRIWCNARSSAAGFYERLGFERHGEEFEIDGIGPHFSMSIRIR